MPRNGSGVYSLPAGSVFTPNTVIESAKVNSINTDLASDLNTARPIVAGGTGATSVAGAQTSLGIDPKVTLLTKTANYTAVAGDNNAYILFTTAATLSLTAAATLGSSWHCYVHAYNVDILIDPNSSETINGKATLGLKSGDACLLMCNGTTFYTRPISPLSVPVVKTANYTGIDTDNNRIFSFTSAATFAIDVTANLRDDWRTIVYNDSTGIVIIDPNSTDTVNGAVSIALQPLQRAEIVKTGSTSFRAVFSGDTFSGPQLQGYYFGLGLSTNATDAANDIDIAVGSAASDTSPYYLMQLTSALTKRMDAVWAVGNNAGGWIDGPGGMPNGNGYLFLMRRSDTGVVDVGGSASLTPTLPTGYDQKRLVGSLVRASATNGTPRSSLGAVTWTELAPVATTSGTAIDITSIPAGVTDIEMWFNGVSGNSTDSLLVQIGTGGSPTTSGYNSGSGTSGAASRVASTAGMPIFSNNATYTFVGVMGFHRTNGNTWVSWHSLFEDPASGIGASGGGSVSLGGALDNIRLRSVAGTMTFDAGTIQVRYR